MFTKSSCYINIFSVLDHTGCIESEDPCSQRERIKLLMRYLVMILLLIIIARKVFFLHSKSLAWNREREWWKCCPKKFSLLDSYWWPYYLLSVIFSQSPGGLRSQAGAEQGVVGEHSFLYAFPCSSVKTWVGNNIKMSISHRFSELYF